MSAHNHAVVWIDHHEARVLYLDAHAPDVVHPDHPPRHLHHKAGSASGSHAKADPDYFRDIATAIEPVKEVLVVGPSGAKTEFVAWLKSHAPSVAGRIFGVEPLQRMTDGEILAEARHFFKRADRIGSPVP